MHAAPDKATQSSLVLIETEDEIVVAWADNVEDWVARFKKEGDFPAHHWASRMQSLYVEQHTNPKSS